MCNCNKPKIPQSPPTPPAGSPFVVIAHRERRERDREKRKKPNG